MIFRNRLRTILACTISLGAFAAPAMAQDIASGNAAADEDKSAPIIVTGSRIKQDPNRSALPLTVITNEDIQRNNLASPEQMTMFLTANGTGPDNLASNADVTTGAQRGTNGLSAANLRGQGAASTLVLLNGRRVAAHGLSGGAVDVNQIPFALVERVEILKDGASAIYGTDAIGGVINYITKKNYTGFGLQGMTDFTEAGSGNIYRISGTAGYGDLASDGVNVMAGVSYSWNKILRGSDRDWVNGNQPNRGLSVDTRGTPIATIFNIGSSPFNPLNSVTGTHTPTLTNGLTLLAPNGANTVGGGINILDLPGGAGCSSMDGGMAYDEKLWNNAAAYYACAWDTGRAAVIQQPLETLTYYAKGAINLGGGHQISAELTGSHATSAKSFSNAQLSANTSNLPIAYPKNALTAPTYDAIFNALVAAFPSASAALTANYGRPIGYRWRCVPCGPREYRTTTNTMRAYLGLEGPLPLEGWDYKLGASHSQSESSSLLGTGYYYRGTLSNGAPDTMAPTAPGASSPGLVGLLNSGILNPFSIDQSQQALDGLRAISAEGTTLYGGRYQVKEVDFSIAGPLFDLPGGKAQLAAGVDWRRETYEFNGSSAALASQPVIFLAAFDNVNALTPKHRTVKAAYAEINLPILDSLTLTGAYRLDDYSGFGTTTNPKVTLRFQPIDQFMLRASYSTGFRVPGFNQIFNGVTESPYSGSDLADPVACPGGVPTSAFGSGLPCAQIRPNIWTGGNSNLGPETAKMSSVGVVLRPTHNTSFSADWWMLNVDNTIQLLSLRQLIDNAALFPERFIRDGSNVIQTIDDRWINAGSRRTQGIEFTGRADFPIGTNKLTLGMDGSLLLKKREKLTPTSAYGPSLIGVFTFTGDLGIRWKHNAWVSFGNDKWTTTLTQVFRSGYENQKLPGVAAGLVSPPDFNPRVKAYVSYNLSASYTGLMPGFKLTFGIKNLLNTDPPFAITYDGNSGAGSSWEPRVADPRGRSFNVQAEVKF